MLDGDENTGGADKLLGVTAPVSIPFYATGLYILARSGIKAIWVESDTIGMGREIINGISQQQML